jgi:serine/threonine-protein kinase RsbW
MSETRNGVKAATPSRTWAVSLPRLEADVVDASDLDRPHLHFKVPATPAQLPILRACLRDWTRNIGMPAELANDVVLAVDEALTNAVEHAYAGTSGAVVLFAACDRRSDTARVVVSDHGTWRPPPSDPGMRGRGLHIMRGLSTSFNLRHDEDGTTVVLGWEIG